MAFGRAEKAEALLGNFQIAFMQDRLAIGSQLGATGALGLGRVIGALLLVGLVRGVSLLMGLGRTTAALGLILRAGRGSTLGWTGLESGNCRNRAGSGSLRRTGRRGGAGGTGFRRGGVFSRGPIRVLRRGALGLHT